MIFLRHCLPLLCLGLPGCESLTITPSANTPPPCSPEWSQMVEQQIGTGDEYGHGPDIGSSEWYFAIHRKLQWSEPARLQPGSPAWCRWVDQAIQYQQQPGDNKAR